MVENVGERAWFGDPWAHLLCMEANRVGAVCGNLAMLDVRARYPITPSLGNGWLWQSIWEWLFDQHAPAGSVLTVSRPHRHPSTPLLHLRVSGYLALAPYPNARSTSSRRSHQRLFILHVSVSSTSCIDILSFLQFIQQLSSFYVPYLRISNTLHQCPAVV